MDINGFPDPITPADVGRAVSAVRGIDWEWRTPPDGAVVLDVRTVYEQPPGVRVEVGANGAGHWYSAENVRLAPKGERPMKTVRDAVEAERTAAFRLRAQARYERMKAGPYVEPNGIGGLWIVIPSDWYDEEARRFWRSIGCRFLRERAWVRQVDLPYKGKTYTTAQWLKAIERKYREFFAEALAAAGQAFSTGGVYAPDEPADG